MLDGDTAGLPRPTRGTSSGWRLLPRAKAPLHVGGHETFQVRGSTVAEARERATEKFGAIEVLDGYHTYSLVGRKQVTLTVRRLPGVTESFSEASGREIAAEADRDVLWNRATLRSLGVPHALLRRLPLDDPATSEQWELVLRELIEHSMSAPAPYTGSGAVSGQGARGAAAVLAGVEAGIPAGTVEINGVRFPATPSIVVLALRSEMPPLIPPAPDPALSVRGSMSELLLPPAPLPDAASAGAAYDTATEGVETVSEPELRDLAEVPPAAESSAAVEDDKAGGAGGQVDVPDYAQEISERPEDPPVRGPEPTSLPAESLLARGPSESSTAAAVPSRVVPGLISGEVTGKIPRSVAKRSVPGVHKTPYPIDEVDS